MIPSAPNSSIRMDIIGEAPKRHATIDPLDFDNISNHSKSSDGEGEISKLDRIPYYDKSIQHVLSNKYKLEYFITNNSPLVINILTSYDLIKE